MIYHKSKQVGFIEHGEANIDKIMHNGNCVFNQGFDRDTSGTDSVVCEGTIGKDVLDWSIVGNTVQDGVPSPSSPVSVLGVGDRTGNLFDGELINGYVNNADFTSYSSASGGIYKTVKMFLTSGTYTVRFSQNINVVRLVRDNTIMNNVAIDTDTVTFTTTTDNFVGIGFRATNNSLWDYSNIMLNEGSTPLPYEPYGVKIPVTCYNADRTEEITTTQYLPTPLMANERLTPTAREVKRGKLVLTGNETFNTCGSGSLKRITSNILDGKAKGTTIPLSTHFASSTNKGIVIKNGAFMTEFWLVDFLGEDIAYNIINFKQWLKSEYDAGHPVTVWYQLANPTTEPIETNSIGTLRNEEKTIKGTTTIITTDTEVLPTQIEASYKSNKVDYVVVNYATSDGNIFTTTDGDTYTIKMRKSQYDTMMTNELLNLLEVM